ncbi:MAG: lipid-A-disaccharide synthase [Roseovarius sp.]|nr:lipid-A-disaccharide synthase [Roseovarius sp.]
MRVFLIAGEASGDRLGASLMAGLKSLADVTFSGIGGPLMQAEGLESLFPMEDLSVMGLAEVLPRYPHLRRRLHEAAAAVLSDRPDVLITIDSPDFCLRVARLVKNSSDIRTVHYVAPSVWAWRPRRAEKMAGVIDHVLALLPFEPPYMREAGMACDFVGHPVVSEPVANQQEIAGFRRAYGLADSPLLLVLPGSRKSEVTRLMPVFSQVVAAVLARRSELRPVIPTTANVASMVRQGIRDWPGAPVLLDPSTLPTELAASHKRAAFSAADAALAASGTVSLELAAADTPMVIAHDMNWLSRVLISRMLRVDTLTLVNLVSGTRAVPEFLGKRCRADLIAPAVLDVLSRPDEQRNAMRETMDRLGRGGEPPGLRAARAVLSGL